MCGPSFRAQKLPNSVFLVKNDGSRSVISISNKFSGGLCTTRVFYMSFLPAISLDEFLDEKGVIEGCYSCCFSWQIKSEEQELL